MGELGPQAASAVVSRPSEGGLSPDDQEAPPLETCILQPLLLGLGYAPFAGRSSRTTAGFPA
jgi:hypothetical protein